MRAQQRVIHYYPRFLHHRSGVTESIAAWAQIARHLGLEVEVWTAGGEPTGVHRDADALAALGIPVRHVPHVGRSGRSYLATWWRARLEPGDIFYVHEGWVPSNLLAVRHARRRGATVVAMPHGVYAPEVVEAGRDPGGIRSRLERRALRRLDAVHLFFASEAREVDTVAGRAVPHGVFSNPAQPVAEDDRWIGNGDYFVWIGRFVVGHKGLDLLLEGWAALAEPRPHLVLAGPDYLGGRAEVEQIVHRLGLEDSVSLRGSVSGAEKDALMVQARGYVHSSRWDACSMVLLEFLSRGTPCLVNSTVHAAADYERAGIALTFRDPSEFPEKIASLGDAKGLGARAAQFMRTQVSPDALAAPYAAWLASLPRRTGKRRARPARD